MKYVGNVTTDVNLLSSYYTVPRMLNLRQLLGYCAFADAEQALDPAL
jgi:hypothetical protein